MLKLKTYIQHWPLGIISAIVKISTGPCLRRLLAFIRSKLQRQWHTRQFKANGNSRVPCEHSRGSYQHSMADEL